MLEQNRHVRVRFTINLLFANAVVQIGSPNLSESLKLSMPCKIITKNQTMKTYNLCLFKLINLKRDVQTLLLSC
jgi:hypothetical protein